MTPEITTKVTIDVSPLRESAIGGGLEGATSTSRETMLWNPSFLSPDQTINPVKETADARTQDMVQNDGYAAGAATLHKDNIVGSSFRLNAKPNYRLLGADESWAEEFQLVTEGRFNTIAESQECWLDASRRNTFAGQIRMAVGGFVMTGEVLATAEWIKDPRRPFSTAVQQISPSRLNNPEGVMDDRNLRRGTVQDMYGRFTDFWIQSAYPTEWYDNKSFQWKKIPAEKPWGRKQVFHTMEQLLPAQSRGIAEMVAALKQMKMTKKFQDVVLQNAVVNATYAAAIESELPTGAAFEMLGANNPNGIVGGMQDYLKGYMGSLSEYLNGAKNIAIDGAKIPHLFPGTKLNMMPIGTPGGIGTGFEESLLRHIAACLGLSYEEFSRDYTKTNYSSARASMNNTWKSMQSKKRSIADRYANFIYALWLEEEIALGNIPLPKGKDRSWFYEPMVKDALTQCTWIGASRGQIDEMKETQAAVLRITSGLSTREKECARLGDDWRDIFDQLAREQKVADGLSLSFNAATTKPTLADNQQNPQDANANNPANKTAA